MKTRTYPTFLVSEALALAAFGAIMIVHGGWQAAVTALAVLAAGVSLMSLISLLAAGERLAPNAPRPARGRAIVRPAPAGEPRGEVAPRPVAPPQPARAEPRPRARVSSTPA
jgi:hypothetical protein